MNIHNGAQRSHRIKPPMGPRLPRYLLLTLVFIYPYTLFLHDIYPVEVLHYSLWVSVLPAAAIVFMFIIDGHREGPATKVLCATASVAIVVALARHLAYDIPLFTALNGLRWCVLVPMFISVSSRILTGDEVRLLARRIIVANTLVAAAIGIVYYLNFTSYRIVAPVSVQLAQPGAYVPAGIKTRASGLLGGPNVFAGFILCGVLLICLTGIRRRSALSLLACAFLLAGIVASGSRTSFSLGLVVTIFFVYRLSRKGSLAIARVSVYVILLLALSGPILQGASLVTGRLSSIMSDTRGQKTALGFRTVFSGPGSVAIGPSLEAQVNNQSNLAVSDNSWILIALSGGVTVFVVFTSGARLLLKAPRLARRGANGRIFGGACMFVLTVNNAIIWDLCVVYAIVGYWIVINETPTIRLRLDPPNAPTLSGGLSVGSYQKVPTRPMRDSGADHQRVLG